MEKQTLREMEAFELFVERCQNIIKEEQGKYPLDLRGIVDCHSAIPIPSNIKEWMDLYEQVGYEIEKHSYIDGFYPYLDIYENYNDVPVPYAEFVGTTISFAEGEFGTCVVRPIDYKKEIVRIARKAIDNGLAEDAGCGMYNFSIILTDKLMDNGDGTKCEPCAYLQVYPYEDSEFYGCVWLLTYIQNNFWEETSLELDSMYEDFKEELFDLFKKEYDTPKQCTTVYCAEEKYKDYNVIVWGDYNLREVEDDMWFDGTEMRLYDFIKKIKSYCERNKYDYRIEYASDVFTQNAVVINGEEEYRITFIISNPNEMNKEIVKEIESC